MGLGLMKVYYFGKRTNNKANRLFSSIGDNAGMLGRNV
jgi:hypothetical protein